MFGSIVIDVALGMVVIYLVLSLAASVLLEALMEVYQQRGRLLQAHLLGLLGPDAAAAFYADSRVLALMSGSHPKDRWLMTKQFNRLYPSPRSAQTERAIGIIRANPACRLPSYIPEATFADVVIDWLREPGSGHVLAPSAATVDGQLLPLAPPLIAAWSNSYRDAGGNVSTFHAALMTWFQRSAERLSGEYRRKARAGLLVLGFGLALLVDAGTPRLMDQLFVTPEARSALVEIGGRIDAADAAGMPRQLTPTQVQAFLDAGHDLLRYPNDPQHSLRAADWLGRCFHLLGYAITALAISLGATFWFSALQKLLSLRNAKQAVDLAQAEKSGHAPAFNPGASATIPPPSLPTEPALDLADLATRANADFQPAASEEAPAQALYLGLCAYLAYLDPDEFKPHPAASALAFDSAELLASKGCEVWLLTRTTHRVLAFRGTETRLDDMLADASFALREEPGAGRVHSGFQSYLEPLWPTVQAQLERTSGPVWFTGHSLGGALAVLAASRWAAHREAMKADPRTPASWLAGVYTFGQPRVGDLDFSRHYDQRLRNRSYRYINHSDIVPTLPPEAAAHWLQPAGNNPTPADTASRRYEHIGQVRYFDVIGQLHRQPDVFLRLLDRFLPPESVLAGGGDSLKHWALARGKEHVGDHAMLAYLKLLAKG